MRNTEMLLTGPGGPERLEARHGETGAPGHGRVLLRMEATGVAFSEVQMLRGRYPAQPRFPFVPGYDLVGTVVEVGAGVDDAVIGNRVAAMPRTGAWQEYVELPVKLLVPVPAEVESTDAVALITNGVTAFQMLHRVARVHPGATVLVHGAGGGVGTLLGQLAVRHGVRVLGTASAGKHSALRELGVEPIDYRAGSVPVAVRELAADGVEAVFDPVGGQSLADSWGLLARGGTLVNYGSVATLDDEGHPLAAYLPLLAKLVSWNLAGMKTRRRLRAYYVRPGKAFTEDLSILYGLLAGKRLSPQIAGQYELARAADALRQLVEGGVTGKLVLVR